jgi:TolB-like protein
VVFYAGPGTISPLTLPSPPAAELPKLASERFSAVVLPFVNLSGDPTQDYLADVVTEELTTALSRCPRV